MAALETLAAIFAILVLVKLLFVIISPKSWMKLTEAVWKNGTLLGIICLVLSAVVGYYIFASISIVQVAAVMLFTSLLIAVAWAPYPNAVLKLRKVVSLKKSWLSVLIWLAIAIWTLYAIFG